MKNNPLVSVVMPEYNEEKTILRAVKSVLSQTYSNLELIVVDDGSTDNSYNLLNGIDDTRLKIIRHKENKGGNTGGSAPRNTGMRAAKGDYIALIDADDEWMKEKIEKQLRHLLSKGKEYAIASCWPLYVDGKKVHVKKYYKEGDISVDLLSMNVGLAFGTTMFFDRKVLDTVGYMDEKFPRHQDFEFMLRILGKYKLAVVKEPLVKIYKSRRTPTPEKLVETKNLFLNRFKELIEKQDNTTQRKIYARNWLQVAKSYASAGDIRNSLRYLKKSLEYKLLASSRIKFLPSETYLILSFLILKSIIKRTNAKNDKETD